MTSPSLPWPDIKALFDTLAVLPLAERASALAAAKLDAAALAEVQSLLDHHDASTGTAGFMAAPAAQSLTGDRVRVGQRLGAWEIVRAIGAGGMGEVFEARRADGQFEGRAAVKLLKRGMDSAVVLQRFALEKQALARLSHPHIAKLLDAGASPEGLPFFVLEYINGQPIDVAAKALPLEGRLGLFLQLADAVAHAHRNLLVHRDLKPGNVLVDQEGQVKLLDFGIAKALDPMEAIAAHDGLHTVAGQRPFTPHYASPEQVRGEPVSTATDIYSLGVLLYQMLTGTRPTGRHASTPAEAARSVLEDTPTKPSRLSASEALDPQWVLTRKRLEGDLDNILLKALEKAPERRYVSVDALAADVRAYVNGYPVGARAASWAYRASKWVGRNRLASAALALGCMGVLGGLATSLWQAHQATVARDDARRQLADVKQIASELVFRYGDVIALLPGGAQAQESLLLQTVASLDVALKRAPDDPELIVLVAQALGRLAQLQGNPSFSGPERAAIADATVARALALGQRVWLRSRGDWRFVSQHLITLLTQAQLQRERSQVAEGLKTLALGVERAGEALAETLPDAGRANILELRANLWTNTAHFNEHAGRPSLGKPEEALKAFARSEADFLALYGDAKLVAAMDQLATPGDPPTEQWRRHNLANVHAGRAVVYQKINDAGAMRREIEQALPLRQQNVDASPTNVTWRQGLMFDSNTLSIALLRLDQAGPALTAAQRAWDLCGELMRESPGNNPWAGARANFSPHYGRALAAAGRHLEAIAAFDIGLQRLAQQRQSADSPVLAQRQAAIQVYRARSMRAAGQQEAAIRLLNAASAQLDPLVLHAAVGRDARLTRALAAAALADFWATSSAAACAARRQAWADLQAAAVTAPLAPDALSLRRSLSAAGSCSPDTRPLGG
jgi:eukaryotic-like serine/threonine-protein kinase